MPASANSPSGSSNDRPFSRYEVTGTSARRDFVGPDHAPEESSFSTRALIAGNFAGCPPTQSFHQARSIVRRRSPSRSRSRTIGLRFSACTPVGLTGFSACCCSHSASAGALPRSSSVPKASWSSSAVTCKP